VRSDHYLISLLQKDIAWRQSRDNGVTGKVTANARLSTDDDQDRKAGRASCKIAPAILSKFTLSSATLRLDAHVTVNHIFYVQFFSNGYDHMCVRNNFK